MNVLVKDNEQAYHEYKRRSLFPKITDNSQAFQQAKGSGGEAMGFVEYQEAQIKELYDIFVSVAQ